MRLMVEQMFMGFSSINKLLLLSTLVALGCDSDPRDSLAKLKQKRYAKVSELYAAYGGGTAAKASSAAVENIEDTLGGNNGEAPPNGSQKSPMTSLLEDTLNTAKTVIKEGDRSLFESMCLQLGSGERVVPLTEKGQKFFADPSTAEVCRSIASMDREIASLEQSIKANERDISAPSPNGK